MSLGDSVVESSVTFVVGGVNWALVLQKKRDHRSSANCSGSVYRVLASFVPNPSRGGGALLEEDACNFQVVLGRNEVQGRL